MNERTRLISDINRKLSRYLDTHNGDPSYMVGSVNAIKMTVNCPEVISTGTRKGRTFSVINRDMKFTILMSCLAEGIKLPLMVVANQHYNPDVSIPKNIIYKYRKEAELDDSLLAEWLNNVWSKRHDNHSFQPNSLLIVGLPMCKTSKLLITASGSFSIFIPQEIKQHVHPLERLITDEFIQKVNKCTTSHKVLHSQKAIHVQMVCGWFSEAWRSIPVKSVQTEYEQWWSRTLSDNSKCREMSSTPNHVSTKQSSLLNDSPLSGASHSVGVDTGWNGFASEIVHTAANKQTILFSLPSTSSSHSIEADSRWHGFTPETVREAIANWKTLNTLGQRKLRLHRRATRRRLREKNKLKNQQ